MSNIIKIFIIINFVLSILYMGIAGTLLAQKWDYKKMLVDREIKHQQAKAKWEEETKDRDAKVQNLLSRLKETTASAIDYKKKYLTTKNTNDQLVRTNNSFDVKLKEITFNLSEIDKKMATKDQRITELETSLDAAKESKAEAIRKRDAAEEKQQELDIELNNLKGELGEKSKLLQRQQKELLEAKQILRSLRDSGINIDALRTTEKAIDGVITATSPELPIVMLSVGTDDGVKKGYQFTVYRGSRYVGKVIVEEVYKDAAAARIVKSGTLRKINKGDSATTRFGGSRRRR